MTGLFKTIVPISSQTLLILCLLIAIPVFAKTKVESMVVCKNGRLARSIRIESIDSSFVTYYTKYGKENRVGSGQNKESQTAILDNIKGNLEGAGWQCRSVKDAQVLEI